MRRPLAAAIALTLASGLAAAEAPPLKITYSEEGGFPELGNGRIAARWTQGFAPVVEVRDGRLPFTIMLASAAEYEDANSDGYYEEWEAIQSATPGEQWLKRSTGYLSSHAFTMEVAGQGDALSAPSGTPRGKASLAFSITVSDDAAGVQGAPLEVNEAMVTLKVESWPWVSSSDVLAVRLLIAGAHLEAGGREVRPETRSFGISSYENRAEVLGRDGALGYLRWPSSAAVDTVLGPTSSLVLVSAGGEESAGPGPSGVGLSFLFTSSYGARGLEFSPVVGVIPEPSAGDADDPLVPALAGLAVVAALALVMFRRRGESVSPRQDR
jgi:hypothetical protein